MYTYFELIYVYILTEGSPTYKKVPAMQVDNLIYIVQGEDSCDREDEHWEHPPGCKVLVKETEVNSEKSMAAIAFSEDTLPGNTTSTIYVPLLNVGMKEWRPVPAIKLDNETYQIHGEDIYKTEDEEWAFFSGTQVIVEEKYMLRSFLGNHKVAVAEASNNRQYVSSTCRKKTDQLKFKHFR